MKTIQGFDFFKTNINTIFGRNKNTITPIPKLNLLTEQNTDDAGGDDDDEY